MNHRSRTTEEGAKIIHRKTYGTRPTKKKRRSKREIEQLKFEMCRIVRDYRPVTVRQVFYQLVFGGSIDKSEAEYKSTVCRLLTVLRKENLIPYHWIADNTRWMRKPCTHGSLEDFLSESQRFYRRDVWESQDCYVEIWLEKEALAGVLFETTRKWDVPLMVCRGYPSLSFLHSAGEAICEEERPVFLYYFGDYDPSGVDISRHVEDKIREFAPETNLVFERVAVNPDQIRELELPTRPTKKSDSRSKNFQGESVEVDAINPRMLQEMCENCIVEHLDPFSYERMKAMERAERNTLATIVANLESDGGRATAT